MPLILNISGRLVSWRSLTCHISYITSLLNPYSHSDKSNMTGRFSDQDPERCAHYAGFMSHLSLMQANIIFWVLFMVVLLLMCVSSFQHHKYVYSDPFYAAINRAVLIKLHQIHRSDRTPEVASLDRGQLSLSSTPCQTSSNALSLHCLAMPRALHHVYDLRSLRTLQYRILRRRRSHAAVLGLLVGVASGQQYRHLWCDAAALDRVGKCPDAELGSGTRNSCLSVRCSGVGFQGDLEAGL